MFLCLRKKLYTSVVLATVFFFRQGGAAAPAILGMAAFEITAPDDLHLHVRDGAMLKVRVAPEFPGRKAWASSSVDFLLPLSRRCCHTRLASSAGLLADTCAG